MKSFFRNPKQWAVTAFLCLISFMVYAQYAVNYDGSTFKIDPRIWKSNRVEILVELGTNAGGGTIIVTNYVYVTNTVVTTNYVYTTNFVNTTNSLLVTNFVYTTNYSVVTNYVNVTNNPAANVALLDAAYQEFTGDSNKFTGKLYAPQAELGDITAQSISTPDPFGINVGGTGARSVGGAQTNLSLVPGTHVQAQSARLQKLADLSLTNVTILVHSNELIQVPISPASVALLKAADAAAQRSLLGVSQIDNSAYGAGWIGVTDKAPSSDAVHAAIAGATGSSNLVKSVDTNYFSVDENSKLLWAGPTNGVGTGATNFTQLSDVASQTPTAGDVWTYDGSAWKSRQVDRFEAADPEWEYMEWEFAGASATAMLEPGLAAAASSSGATYQTNYVFSAGQNAYACAIRSANSDTLISGSGVILGAVTAGMPLPFGTNIHKMSARLYIVNSTAAAESTIGWTYAFYATPYNQLAFRITNMVVYPVAMSNTALTVGSSYTLSTSVDYTFELRHTNVTAQFVIKSNSVSVFTHTITNNIPITANGYPMGVGITTRNQTTAGTNGVTLMVIDRFRVANKIR